jgi:wyosine [tRNA(Phe)-imidazoG37] synthetase (radical SAM superfamily)
VKKLVFGPVPSRRLGFSLGVDLIPRKYCSFDCIYCQLGPTTQTQVERRSFCDPASVVEQVVERVKEGGRIDYVSLSGSGEPTLNSDIGWVIKRLKDRVSLPVAVITNGSLLDREDVRKDLMAADVVLPSLDAASEAVYKQINRPHESLEFDNIIGGLEAFCNEYKGRVWLEVLLIDNINNDSQHIEMFKKIIDKLPVEKVQLNTVVRPPAEKAARRVSNAELLSISRVLGPRSEVVAGSGRVEKQATGSRQGDWENSVLSMLGRRSLSLDDIVRSTGVPVRTAREGMKRLVEEGRVETVVLGRRRFYLVPEQAG